MAGKPKNTMSAEAATEPFSPKLDYTIQLPAFEGPMDLLLFLIRKNEVDIYDIPIHTVTKQYLDVLYAMQKLNLEVAGEFFVMASTLMYIKSRMLLPKDEQLAQPEEEEEADPRWELIQQLVEYKRFKEAAGDLGDLIEQRQDYLPRFYKSKDDERYQRPLKKADKIDVWNTFNLVLRRLAEKIVQGEIHDDTVTVSDRMEYVLTLCQRKKEFTFSSLFREGDTLSHIVSTFLAILELTRLKKLTIEQTHNFTDILCLATEGDDSNDSDIMDFGSEFDEPSGEKDTAENATDGSSDKNDSQG